MTSAAEQLKFLVWKWCQMNNLIVFQQTFDNKIMTFPSELEMLGCYYMK